MSEYKRYITSELENLLDLMGGGEPPLMETEVLLEVLNRKLSPEAKKIISQGLCEK